VIGCTVLPFAVCRVSPAAAICFTVASD
jgi:hypothetical protein